MRRALSLFALLVSVGGTQAFAQGYKSDPVDTKLSRFGLTARKYAADPSDTSKAAEFRGYFEKFYFPSMTSAAPEKLEEVGKLQQDLFRNYIWKADPRIQKELSAQVLDYAKRVISGPYAPAVRYNAVLALGKLDDTYSTGTQPPKVSVAANNMLGSLVAASLKSPKWPRNLLAGSLVGLDRHTMYFASLPRAEQDKTIATLLAVLKTKDLGGDASAEVTEWIRLRAASALANLGTPGEQNAILAGITQLIADKDLSQAGRCAAAGLLPKLKLDPAATEAAKPTVAALQALAADFARAEAKFCEEFEDLNLGGGGGGLVSAVDQRSILKSRIKYTETGVELIRSGIVAKLKGLRDGMTAIKPAAGDASDALGTAIGAITGLIETASDKESLDLDVIDELKGLESILTASAPAADEPAEPSGDGLF
jgi:hypothetical protein